MGEYEKGLQRVSAIHTQSSKSGHEEVEQKGKRGLEERIIELEKEQDSIDNQCTILIDFFLVGWNREKVILRKIPW